MQSYKFGYKICYRFVEISSIDSISLDKITDYLLTLSNFQMGTLAGNLSIKNQHPEFPSDVYVVFEALDVQVVIKESATQERTVSLSEYLKTDTTNKVLKSFVLKPYNNEQYIFGSYKVSNILISHDIGYFKK